MLTWGGEPRRRERPAPPANFTANTVKVVVVHLGSFGGIGNSLMRFWVVIFALLAIGDAYFARVKAPERMAATAAR